MPVPSFSTCPDTFQKNRVLIYIAAESTCTVFYPARWAGAVCIQEHKNHISKEKSQRKG